MHEMTHSACRHSLTTVWTYGAVLVLVVTLPLLLSTALASAQLIWIMPSIKDPDFVIETFVAGIPSPTTMAFVGDDVLVLQKVDGQVRLVRDGVLQPEPVLDVNVASVQEQGMLGIAAVDSIVYLYFTESEQDGGEAMGRRVYKYDWTGSELANPVLVKDMSLTSTYHNGGAMAVGPDETVYLIVGDAGRYGQLQNHGDEFYPDTSVIMPVSREGPYFAMGIRNSFGLTFDPYTDMMWSTENGNENFDEINLVKPYTNSGWDVVMGPATDEQLMHIPTYQNYTYRDPVFSWEESVAPTALSFVQSEPLAKFADSLFVGDCNNGRLYKFPLNADRDGFAFNTLQLADGVANRGDPLEEIVFGQDFICITDIKVGPDGLLYIVSLSQDAIFRVVPNELARSGLMQLTVMQIGIFAGVAIAAGLTVYGIRFLKRKRHSMSST
jgi:aldose sugar dehydrogenase